MTGTYDLAMYDALETGMAGGIFAAILVAYTGLIIFGFIVYVFETICLWKVFEKAGKPGWASIIPVYNIWILFEIAGFKGAYSLLMLIPIVGALAVIILTIISYFKIAKAFGKDAGFGVGLWLLNPIFIAILAFDKSTYLGAEQ